MKVGALNTVAESLFKAAAAIAMRGRAQKRKGKHAISSNGYIGHVIAMSKPVNHKL